MAHGGKREGAGRKKMPHGAKRVSIAMRVSPACNEWLRDQAKEYELSLGEMVEQMMYVWREYEKGYQAKMQSQDSWIIEHILDGGKDIFRIK
jgi:hypothetical protein